ncbi:MAG: hypothetical protein R3B40_22465 [Polyangiales bacterium]
MSTWRTSWSAAARVACAVLALTGCGSDGAATTLCGPNAFAATQDAVTFCGFTGDDALVACPADAPNGVDFVGLRVCSSGPVEFAQVPDRVCMEATGQACDALTRVVPGLYLGEACQPVNVPGGGFGPGDVYLERPNAACGVDWCMVYMLEGDPTDTGGARMFCTCRCEAPDGEEVCACAEGFLCESVGGLEPTGYCVREDLVEAP